MVIILVSSPTIRLLILFNSVLGVTTYGESHCKSVGCIVDGIPPGMDLTEADIQPQLSRRRPGQSKLSTPVGITPFFASITSIT